MDRRLRNSFMLGLLLVVVTLSGCGWDRCFPDNGHVTCTKTVDVESEDAGAVEDE